jgi:hypothetical protein
MAERHDAHLTAVALTRHASFRRAQTGP